MHESESFLLETNLVLDYLMLVAIFLSLSALLLPGVRSFTGPPVPDCADTSYGCCPDRVTAAAGPNAKGCPSFPGL